MKVQSTNEVKTQGVAIFIYGESGAGKTLLASTLTGKTLIISAEGGLLTLKKFNMDFIELKGPSASAKAAHLKEIMLDLFNNNEYDNIFIDSLTEISAIFVDHNFELVNNDSSKSLPAYMEATKQLKSFIKFCRDTKKYNFILTGLDQVDKDELNRRYKLPDLLGKTAKQLPQFFDEVFYLEKSDEEKEDKSKVRYLYTEKDQAITKDRSRSLPAMMKDANLADIIKKVKE